ncbi:MAG: phosphoadenosine phosphosulfate reductase family protein [Proteobacteria bacterium]|nr:phosphoadenosine phosphosulfate reductase family protein [Pseudomonadota bacterium]
MPSLDDAIRATETLLAGLLAGPDPARIRVAWTGGKDSTVVLFIWKALLEHHGLGPVRAINLDTGCKFPEIIAFRDQLAARWGVDLHIARPGVVLDGYPVARDVIACCRDLKIEPLARALRQTGASHLITGIRRDEHPDRAGRLALEPRQDPPHVMVNPILDWTETDIWAFHARYDLPHCPLYDQGYRSLGCRPCTALPGAAEGERGGRDQAKERALHTLTSLGYF